METYEDRWCISELLRVKGRLAWAKGSIAAAEENFQEASAWARRQGALSWELRAVTCLAQLRYRTGDVADACELLSSVHDRFTEGTTRTISGQPAPGSARFGPVWIDGLSGRSQRNPGSVSHQSHRDRRRASAVTGDNAHTHHRFSSRTVTLDAPAALGIFFLFFTRVNSRPFGVARLFRRRVMERCSVFDESPLP